MKIYISLVEYFLHHNYIPDIEPFLYQRKSYKKAKEYIKSTSSFLYTPPGPNTGGKKEKKGAV